MVYVISHTGAALMPTERHGKVRRLLRDGLAHVVNREPFTIQLDYESTEFIQPITLGVDAGTCHVGLSATTESKELFTAEVVLRRDVVSLISTRKEMRRTRRNRTTRYRASRFNNRKRCEGWIAPSVEQSVNSHIALIRKAHSLLPIKKIVIEVAQFDTQLLKNPQIENMDYQHGEQMGFWNVREYVLFRDNHACQHCKGKSKDPILNVHHIESRKTGGNAPNNLITLCETCHTAYHKGQIDLNIKRGKSLRDAAMMSIMRWRIYERAKKEFSNVCLTYGYITKKTRIENGLKKSHCVDARCISGHPKAQPSAIQWKIKQVRRHNRSLHVMRHSRGGKRPSTIAPHWIGTSRLQRYDKVLWRGVEAFISGSTNGRLYLRNIEWQSVTPTRTVNIKQVSFLYRKRSSFLYSYR